MGSAIVFLMCASALLPLLAAQEDDKPCVFPFTYQKKSFSSCTTYGSADEKLWCATTPNYDKHIDQWKWCATQEYGGNSLGRPCVFPFLYRKKTYYTCVPEKPNKFNKTWCATTGSYDKDKKWSYCADTRLSAEPIGPCIFPFVFEGQSRSTCVTDGSPNGKPFCSLTDHYDADLKKVPCENSDHRQCFFPFTYKGKQYCLCTRDGTKGGPLWCATTPNYDNDKKWKVCEPKDPEKKSSYGGCTFPFTYFGRSYSSCTNDWWFGNSPWCSETSGYTLMGWIYCSHTCG